MSMPVNNNVLKSTCGDYFTGLTKSEAMKKGIDIKLFDKIDAYDGEITGTLTENDILIQRDKKSGDKQTRGAIAAGVALAAATFGGPIGWTICALGALWSSCEFHQASNIDKGTERYLMTN